MPPKYWVQCLLIVAVYCEEPERTQTPQPLEVDEPVIYPEDYCQQFDEDDEFDFVVIGSGPGGAIVARRLAEIEDNEVLLLEAGGDPPPSSDLASNIGSLPEDALWRFGTDPSTGECKGFLGNSCPLQVAKVLGGNSCVNLMQHVRGNPQDFDDIEELGNPGWGYKDMLNYFKKLENYIAGPIEDDDSTESSTDGCEGLNLPSYSSDTTDGGPSSIIRAPVSSKYHAKGGPQKNGQFPFDPYSNGIRMGMEKAFENASIKFNPDYNGKSQMGYTRLTGSIDEIGYRYNIAKAYLTKIPKNLKVCKHSLVTRILFHGKEATGVEFLYTNGNETRKMHQRGAKEYIVSGGPYNSPALLERSGIGRKDVLKHIGVRQVHELPGVGENLRDHYLTLSSAFKVNPGTAVSPSPVSLGIAEFGAFVNTTDPSSEVPDIQYLFTFYQGRKSSAFENIRPSIDRKLREAGTILHGGTVVLRELTPGSTHISQTRDSTKSPVIIEKAYETRDEVKEIVRGITKVRDILLTPAMKDFDIELFVLPQCNKFPPFTEQEIMCGCKLLSRPIYHATGTCKMGPDTDAMSVVDSRLRVHGLKGLRVIDSSIFPLNPRGNTQVPTMAVGEKGADLIKEDYGQI